MRTLIAALMSAGAVLAAGCTPMPATEAAETTAQSPTAEAAACAARNGAMRPVGRLQTMQCVVRYADADKTCTDGDQCEGDCRVEGNSGLASGAAASGQCQATSDRFGCFTRVEDGKAGATLCID